MRSFLRGGSALVLVFGAVALGSACGARGPDLAGRMATAKQAAESFGYAAVGPAQVGTLTDGGTAAVSLALKEGCYQITVFAGDGVRGTELSLADPSGKPTGSATLKQDGQSSIKQCLSEPGTWVLTVKSTGGAGLFFTQPYASTSGSGASGGAKTPGDDVGAIGTIGGGPVDDDGSDTASNDPCSNGIDLDPGARARGNSKDRPVYSATGTHPTCSASAGAQVVYRMHVEGRHKLVLDLDAKFDAVLAVFRASASDGYLCEEATELECSDDSDGSVSKAHVETLVDTGDYGVMVTGYDGERGEFDLRSHLEDAPALETYCAAARTITAGKKIEDATAGGVGNFQNGCSSGTGAGGDELLYKLDVTQPSRLRATSKAGSGDVSIAMRSRCDDPTSELFCSHTWHLDSYAWTGIVKPGSYVLIADTSDPSRAVTIDTKVDVAPLGGSGVEGDACADAKPLLSGDTVADTFLAKEDVATGCSAHGPDVVYKLDVKSRSRVTILGNEDEGGQVLSLQRTCGDATSKSELHCGSATDGKGIDKVLDPGSYYLVVKGKGADNFGRARFNTKLRDLASLAAACKSPPVLTPGKPISDTTKDAPDRFSEAQSCAGVPAYQASGDKVYQFTLKERTKVNVALKSGAFSNALLSLRSDCADPTKPEIVCSYTYNKQIDRELDPGTYFVVVDGYGTKSEGAYTIELTVKK
jgi:hypothetical protein